MLETIDERRGSPRRLPSLRTLVAISIDAPGLKLSDLDSQPLAEIWLRSVCADAVVAHLIAGAAGLGGER
jgi:hypothetical protein